MAEARPLVFISYARADDEPFVERLHKDLTDRDVQVWWDRKAMESRGRTFLQEIRDAIEAADRVIAVVGPRAVKSDYVRYEWEYALLFCRGVVPVLRRGEHDQLPENLREFHCPDFREQRPYADALEELLRILRTPVPQLGPIRATPALPPHFLARRDDVERLQSNLFVDIHRPVVTKPAQQVATLQGMGGVGKSVLAAALARAVKTRLACGDGVLWLTFGQDLEPSGLLSKLKLTGLAFDDDPKYYFDEESARSRLSQVLNDKTCLIVLDDVWRVEHAEPFFNALGPRCRLLITTRDAGLATAFEAQEHPVNALTDAEALRFLAEWSGQSSDALPPLAGEVAAECGNLPLALAMVGAMVRDNPNRWEGALRRLRNADLEKIKGQFPNYTLYPNLLRSLQVSVEALEPEVQSRYLELAVFPKGTAIPGAALQVLWEPVGFDADDAQDAVDLFVRRSLARRDDGGRITLHDLQFDYVYKQADDLAGLHRRLLKAYEKHCPGGWPRGPNDGYFFQFAPYHFTQAGEAAVLHDLLLDYKWIQAKLNATDAQAVIADYDRTATDEDLRPVQQALRLAAYVLSADRAQLPGQLIGRLRGVERPKLRKLLEKAEEGPGVPWLCPRTASLISPGTPLLRTIRSGSVARSLVRVPKTRRILAGTDDGTLELIEPDEGRVAHVLQGHGGKAFAVTPDGRFAVSGAGGGLSRGSDCYVKVWDLGNLSLAHNLEGHSNPVNAVAVSLDSRLAVSASDDGTLCVWDIGSGELRSSWRAHEQRVTAVALTPQGDRIVSASKDGELKVWDLNSGGLSLTLSGPAHNIDALVVTADGRRAISADRGNNFTSEGSACRSWNLDDGALLYTLDKIYGGESAFAVSDDGRYAVAGRGYGICSVFDVNTGALVNTLDGRDWPISAVAISPDGRRIISAALSGVCWLWDSETGAQLQTLIGHGARVNAATVGPDGTWAVTASNDGTYRVWDLLAQTAAPREAHARQVNDIGVTADGRRAVSASEDGTLKVWDVNTGALLRTLAGHSSGALRLKIIQETQRVASVSRDNTLRVWDFETGECLHEFAKEELDLSSVAFTNDGRLACAVYSGGRYKLCDLMTGEILLSKQLRADVRGRCLLTPDGNLLLSANFMDPHVTVWDIETGRVRHRFEGYRGGGVAALTLTPDGRRAVFPLKGERLSLWDLHSGTMVRTLSGEAGHVNHLVVAPNGRDAVSGSDKGVIGLWDLEDDGVRILSGQTGMVWGLAISPDSRRAVTGSQNGTCQIWDLVKLRLLATFQADTAIGAVVWAGDQHVLAASHEGAVHVLLLKE